MLLSPHEARPPSSTRAPRFTTPRETQPTTCQQPLHNHLYQPWKPTPALPPTHIKPARTNNTSTSQALLFNKQQRDQTAPFHLPKQCQDARCQQGRGRPRCLLPKPSDALLRKANQHPPLARLGPRGQLHPPPPAASAQLPARTSHLPLTTTTAKPSPATTTPPSPRATTNPCTPRATLTTTSSTAARRTKTHSPLPVPVHPPPAANGQQLQKGPQTALPATNRPRSSPRTTRRTR